MSTFEAAFSFASASLASAKKRSTRARSGARSPDAWSGVRPKKTSVLRYGTRPPVSRLRAATRHVRAAGAQECGHLYALGNRSSRPSVSRQRTLTGADLQRGRPTSQENHCFVETRTLAIRNICSLFTNPSGRPDRTRWTRVPRPYAKARESLPLRGGWHVPLERSSLHRSASTLSGGRPLPDLPRPGERSHQTLSFGEARSVMPAVAR